MAALTIGTHMDKAVMTPMTAMTYQSRMSSGERWGRLRRIGNSRCCFPSARNATFKSLFQQYIFAACEAAFTFA